MQPQSDEPHLLQPEGEEMEDNKEEEIEEDKCTEREEDGEMAEDREPQLETLGPPKLDGRKWHWLFLPFFHFLNRGLFKLSLYLL